MFAPLMGASDFNSSSFGSLRIGPFPGEEPTIQEIIEYLDSNQPLVHALYELSFVGMYTHRLSPFRRLRT